MDCCSDSAGANSSRGPPPFLNLCTSLSPLFLEAYAPGRRVSAEEASKKKYRKWVLLRLQDPAHVMGPTATPGFSLLPVPWPL